MGAVTMLAAAPGAVRSGAGAGAGPEIRRLGLTEHGAALSAMRAFTAARGAGTADQIWLTEHYPVYTLGLAHKREHVLDARGIPVVATDRGGR